MASTREYPARPLVGIGAVIFRKNTVLLIRRGRPPAQGAWSFPGGAQRLGETAEQAASRELLEETGVRAGPLILAGHVDSIHTGPDGRIRYHYTILDFCGHYAEGEARAGGDAADIAWARLDRLDDYALWDEAIKIIQISQARLGVTRHLPLCSDG